MKRLRWQLLVVLLALVAIGMLLFSQQQSPLPAGERVEEPVAGGVYSEAMIGSLNRLNPVLDFSNPVDYDVDRLIFSSLVRFDHRGLPHGDLAETWGISQDGKVYNFSIRPNAVWHDGKPVTSQDVIFTIDLLRNDELPIPSDINEFWKQVEVEALDDKTLQFRLPEAFSPFLDYLTFGVLPSHLLSGLTPQQLIDAPFNLSPVGSGPYRFGSLTVEEGKIAGLTLLAFDGYYSQKSFIDQVVFRYYDDSNAALAAYKEGAVMGISRIPGEALPQALKEPGLSVFTSGLPRLALVYLNLDNSEVPYFEDAAVRRALMMGINRRWIVDRLLGGQAILANGPILPENWAYYEGTEHVPYDAEGAVSLLKEAGYTVPAEGEQIRAKDGVPLSFEMVHPEGALYTAIAERIRDDWLRLGVEVKLTAVPYEQLMQDYLEPRTYQAALAELNFERAPDPDPYPFWHQAQIANGQNYSQWNDRQVSEYLEQARVLDDYNERAKRYRNFQVRFSSALPALPLFHPVYSYAVSDQVKGVSMGPLYDPSDRFGNIASWYLITGPAAQVIATPTPTP